jgi:hypothetical protein
MILRAIRTLARVAPLLLLLTACSLRAFARIDDVHPTLDPHHVDGLSLGGPIDLSSTWLIKQGDDLRYADPHWNDTSWAVVKSGPYSLPGQSTRKEGGADAPPSLSFTAEH